MPSVEGRQPSGTYRIVMDDDEVAIIPFAVTTRIAINFHTPALSLTAAVRNVFTITAEELATAIEADRQREAIALLDGPEIRL